VAESSALVTFVVSWTKLTSMHQGITIVKLNGNLTRRNAFTGSGFRSFALLHSAFNGNAPAIVANPNFYILLRNARQVSVNYIFIAFVGDINGRSAQHLLKGIHAIHGREICR